MLDILKHDAERLCKTVPYPIHIITTDMEIWRNEASIKEFPQKAMGIHCFEVIFGKSVGCKKCPAREVFSSARGQKRQRAINSKIYEVAIEPILDRNGSIIAVLEVLVDITEQVFQQKKLERANRICEEKSITDYLTNALNRRGGIERLRGELDRLNRYDNIFSLIMFDIDEFKKVNDEKGHIAGDKLLIKIVEIVKSLIRESDCVARYGGDEFLLIIPETGYKGAIAVAEKVRKAIKKGANITISLGVMECSEKNMSEDVVLHKVDELMYESKNNGGDSTTSSHSGEGK